MMRRLAVTLGLFGVSLLFAGQTHAAAPHVYRAAYLGGTVLQWMYAKGTPMKGSTQRVKLWLPCPDGTTPQLTVRFAGDRAVSIQGLDCPGESLDTTARRSEAILDMPGDAAIRGTFPVVYHAALRYQSRSLALLFPALIFQDCAGKLLPRGTFFLDPYTPRSGGWTLGVGTCVT